MLEKSFFDGSRANLVKIVFWKKKKVVKFAQKYTENPWFFEFLKVIKWPEVAENYPKTSALPQRLSQNVFFVSQTQKFMKIFQKTHPPSPQKGHFFFLGGG